MLKRFPNVEKNRISAIVEGLIGRFDELDPFNSGRDNDFRAMTWDGVFCLESLSTKFKVSFE